MPSLVVCWKQSFTKGLMTKLKSQQVGKQRSSLKRSYHHIRLGEWRRAGSSLEAYMEACSVRVGNKLYVIGGYQTLTQMCERMQICDIESGKWSYGPELPQGFPLSHAGIASDGRFLFVVSGQPGPACEPATNKAWLLDLEQMIWEPMPPLPVARFAPVLEYVDGNLHLITGATEDRETISDDHFILQIRDPEAEVLSVPTLEAQVWRKGPPIPSGGDHAGSVVLDGKIYVIGGEHGHARVTMDPSKCCGTYHVHNYLFRYEPARERMGAFGKHAFRLLSHRISNRDYRQSHHCPGRHRRPGCINRYSARV